MSRILSRDKGVCVVGLGVTGLSCARYLQTQGTPFVAMDSRETPPGLSEWRQHFRDVPLHLGGFRQDWLEQADEIWLSPGVALDHPDIAPWRDGKRIRGDVDVFSTVATAPIVAITGSNGKSTVTTLVGDMARAAGIRVQVGGNLGTPVLDLLSDNAELYVVEVSSFQLETTQRLNAAAATILNLSQDHMDRYPDMLSYHRAKLRVFFGCRHGVVNRDDPLAQPPEVAGVGYTRFTLKAPQPGEYGVVRDGAEYWLAKGTRQLLNVSTLRIRGAHNWANALAALALAEAVNIPLDACLQALAAFPGLPHRCEWVAESDGVTWFNDSKATNVGAALAAIEGLAPVCPGRIVLIAGGQGKKQDFQPLARALSARVADCILLGEDADEIASSLAGTPVQLHRVMTMAEAVATARRLAQPGDFVLLSPACASLDMFRDYQHRGHCFSEEVRQA